MPLYEFDGKSPRIAEGVYIADSAVLIGDITIGVGSSVWPGAVLRGDNDAIRIGAESSIQEGAVLHTDRGFPLVIGNRVTVGHQAMLHGCIVEDKCLVGIKATILNGALIGSASVVGAAALITEGKRFGRGLLIIGVPAKEVGEVPLDKQLVISQNVDDYVEKARLYIQGLRLVD